MQCSDNREMLYPIQIIEEGRVNPGERTRCRRLSKNIGSALFLWVERSACSSWVRLEGEWVRARSTIFAQLAYFFPSWWPAGGVVWCWSLIDVRSLKGKASVVSGPGIAAPFQIFLSFCSDLESKCVGQLF